MKILLDTNIYLWFEKEDSRLSPIVLNAIKDPSNQIMISIVSIWEIALLLNLKKIELEFSLEETIRLIQSKYNFEILQVKPIHCVGFSSLPYFVKHKNPFDRMIISQAITEKIKLAANDQFFPNYPVDLFW